MTMLNLFAAVDATSLPNIITVFAAVFGFAAIMLALLFWLTKFVGELNNSYADLNDVDISPKESDTYEDRKK